MILRVSRRGAQAMYILILAFSRDVNLGVVNSYTKTSQPYTLRPEP